MTEQQNSVVPCGSQCLVSVCCPPTHPPPLVMPLYPPPLPCRFWCPQQAVLQQSLLAAHSVFSWHPSRLHPSSCLLFLSSQGAWKDKWKAPSAIPIRMKDKYWRPSVRCLPHLIDSPLFSLHYLFGYSLKTPRLLHMSHFITVVLETWMFHLHNKGWEPQLMF